MIDLNQNCRNGFVFFFYLAILALNSDYKSGRGINTNLYNRG